MSWISRRAIKARIKERLASYTDPSDLNEIAAHTAELIFYDGLEASPDVEEVLSQCVDLSASRIKRTKRLTK